MISRRNSIILDFEGFIDKPPTLCGVWFNEIFKMVIFDSELKGVCNDSDIFYLDLTEFLKQTILACQENELKIIGYTQRELNVFNDNGIDLSLFYIDAKRLLKSWYIKNDPGNRPRPFALDSVLKKLGYPVYQFWGNQQTTQRIKSVRDQLINRNQNYSLLTPTTKGKWTKVYKYNQQDVIGLLWALEVTKLITTE
jgi:hypothetical protein